MSIKRWLQDWLKVEEQDLVINGLPIRLTSAKYDEVTYRIDLLCLPTVAQAAALLASDIAQVPFYVYQIKADGEGKTPQ